MLIALDWGLTRLRAYLMDDGGAIVERHESEAGVLSIADGGFEAALTSAIADWPEGPIVASGMITSRQGWVETEYLACPAGAGEIAAALTVHKAAMGPIHFAPGLVDRGAGGVPDVMRGEETQIAGALAPGGGAALLLLPGTHSKWARAAGGRVQGFATFMTGEVYAVLCRHSILGRMMAEGPEDAEAFLRGLDDAWNEARAGGLLHRLFGTRTLALFEELAETQTADYLSGLLIGQEVAEGLAMGRAGAASAVTIVGAADLAARYETALAHRGVEAVRAPADIAAAGLHAIARAAGLIGETA